MRIIFAGTPEYAVPSLRALVDSGHEVVGVLTREDAPIGRKRVLTASPVASVAEELGLPVHKANRLDEAATAWADALHPELGVIVAYGGLVREPLLSLPTLGWINLHFSDLPSWRGAAPVQRALMAGEQRLGVTVFRLVEGLDAGAVLTRDSREFAVATSAGKALEELASFGTVALLAGVETLVHDPGAGTEQSGEVTYAHKLSREDGRLDVAQNARAVLSHWAGVTPEPGAFVLHEGQVLKLIELCEVDEEASLRAGEVRFVGEKVLMGAGEGAVHLTRVQPAAKPVMNAADWLRGRGGEARLS